MSRRPLQMTGSKIVIDIKAAAPLDDVLLIIL